MDHNKSPVRPHRVEVAVALLLVVLAVGAIRIWSLWGSVEVSRAALETLRILLIVIDLAWVAVYLALLKGHRWALVVTAAFFIWEVLSSGAGLWRGILGDARTLTISLSFVAVRSVAIAMLLSRVSRQWFRNVRAAPLPTISGNGLLVDGGWRNATPR